MRGFLTRHFAPLPGSNPPPKPRIDVMYLAYRGLLEANLPRDADNKRGS